MSSAILTVMELVFFVCLVGAYFYIATHPSTTKTMKLKEIILMYGITLFYAFSKRISALFFIMTAIAIVIFKILQSKSPDRNKNHQWKTK